MRENRYENHNPSFSSSLLDQIYRSISEIDDTQNEDLKFYRDPMPKSCRLHHRRDCLIDKLIDRKTTQQNTKYRRVPDEDSMLFSSTSISSDSSSGGFSSSDTESFCAAKSESKSYVSVSAQIPATRPKPVKTRPENSEAPSGDYRYNSAGVTEETPKINKSIFKSKSRALKIYNNLKNLKQPISPGGKLANFINSIFAKSKSNSPVEEEREFKSAQASTCSSASSFSRSCLSKPEKFRDGVKRSVRFYPVSVIVDEDCRPCGHKSLYKEEEESQLMSVSVPTAWKIGKSPTKKSDSEFKYRVTDKSRRVEEVARDILREYHKKNDYNLVDEEDEEDDDAASDSSSDLFELDNLALIGKDRGYCEELPVYETTHLTTNRAIANGLRL